MMDVTQIKIFFVLFWLSIGFTGYYFGKVVLSKIGKDKAKTIAFACGCFILAIVFYVVCHRMGVI